MRMMPRAVPVPEQIRLHQRRRGAGDVAMAGGADPSRGGALRRNGVVGRERPRKIFGPWIPDPGAEVVSSIHSHVAP
jgi:hypothetical protein